MRTTEATRTALYDALESQPQLSRILTGHAADKFFASSSSFPSGISELLYHPRTGSSSRQVMTERLGSTALHVDGGGVVWELQVDGSAGEHDGGQRGFGTVEAVGAADDQTYLVVQSFLAAV
jgi:hypothetical protein